MSLIEKEVLEAARRKKEAAEGPLPGMSLEDIPPEPMKWLWKGRIRHQALTTFASDPGVGKGTFLHCILVPRITRGDKLWPDGSENMLGEPRHVIVVGDEDHWRQTVRPRFDLVGVNRKFVRCVGISEVYNNWDKWERLQKELNPGLWICDPFDQMIGEPKHNSMGGWGKAMAAYKDFVARHDTSIIGVMHMTKSKEGKSATNMAGGSIKFAASTRGSYNIMWSPNDKDIRLVVPGKPQNNAPRPSNMSFKVEPPSDEAIKQVLSWDSYRNSKLTPEKLHDVWIVTDLNCNVGYDTAEEISGATARGKAQTSAEDYLLRAMDNGPRVPFDVIDARPGNISERALRTAFRKLGGRSLKQTKENPLGLWELPNMPDEETTL